MDWRARLPRAFNEPVTSIEDFCERIELINNDLIGAGVPSGITPYYRGDRYCSRVQSNLFRKGYLPQESLRFSQWKDKWARSGNELKANDFDNLVRMQHENNDTRLLDFTTDPLVALRFACGNIGDNCRKKVTVFATCDTVVSKDNEDYLEKCNAFISLVTQGSNSIDIPSQYKDIYGKDYFIEALQDFERIKRQSGLFLFMGNLMNNDMFSKSPNQYNHKVMHELSDEFGRGNEYSGFIGVLDISAECVPGIRRVLEQTACYNIDYLLPNNKDRSATVL